MDTNTPGSPPPASEDLSQTRYIPTQEVPAAAPEQARVPVQPQAPYNPAPQPQYTQPYGSQVVAPVQPVAPAQPQAPVPPQQPYGQQVYNPSQPYAPQQPYPPQAPVPPTTFPQSYAPPPSSTPSTGFGHTERDRTLLAIILIGGGILFFLDSFLGMSNFGSFILLGLGAAFLYAYFNTQQGYRIGFLIPGSILLGLGVGELFKDFTPWSSWNEGNGDISALTLGLGFCLIWFLERKHWWALIPGLILVATGISTISIVGNMWPLVLVAVGIYILYTQSRQRAH